MNAKLLTAGIAVLGLSGAALASGNDIVNLGGFTLLGGESIVFGVDLPANDKDIVGVIISFDYDGFDDGSWAADTKVVLSNANGVVFDIGGFDNPTLPWSFDGSGSAPAGYYEELAYADYFALDPQPKGTWDVTITNDWAADAQGNAYDNFTIEFVKVPAPASLALLGLAGLTASRRRRG